MILYYSGASSNNAIQTSSSRSLGGYISSSLVPNGAVGNLFDTLTPSSNTQCRLIVLKNSFGDLSNVLISIEDSSHIEYKIAAVSPTTDSCSNSIFEIIQAEDNLPYQAVLAKHNLIDPISIPSLISGAVVGIWIQRKAKNTEDSICKALTNKELTCEEFVILEKTLEDEGISEDAALTISWD